MNFEELSTDEVRELKRARPVTREELDDLVRQVGSHYRAELRRIQHLTVAQENKQDLEDAASRAQGYAVTKLIETWNQTGEAIPWHAGWQAFKHKCNNEFIDVKREKTRLKKLADAVMDLRDHFDEGKESNDPRRRSVTLGSRRPPVVPQDELVEALSPPLLVAVALRTLAVASRRDRPPVLSSEQQQVMRIHLELELSLELMTDEDLAVLKGLPKRHVSWKGGLAGHLGRSATFISQTLKLIEKLIRLGIYLFAELPPEGHAVIDPSQISRLLDLVHTPNEQLQPAEQKILQLASVHLQLHGGIFYVDVDALANSLLEWDCTRERLQHAELRYIRHLPPHHHMNQCATEAARD